MYSTHSDEPILAAPDEQLTLHLIDDLFRDDQHQAPKLLGPDGEEYEFPESLLQVLKQLVHDMSQGHAVTLIAREQILTTQQAADILNVSRPHLVRLLEENSIPFIRTGKHRRVNIEDILVYKRKREAQRQKGLAEITRLGEQMGDYD